MYIKSIIGYAVYLSVSRLTKKIKVKDFFLGTLHFHLFIPAMNSIIIYLLIYLKRIAAMTRDFVLKGNIVHAVNPGELSVKENGYLVVRDGNVKEILREYGGEVTDYGNSLIIPGLCDMHVHAPQYAMAGFGLDMELLQWLKTYAFPEESKYSDPGYAAYVYEAFAKALVAAGTTRACVYGTIHTDTVLMLMDILESAGITAYVGKVNMDRNAPEPLCEDTGRSISETKRWLKECEGRFKHVKPILTPRFIPACSPALLKSLGEMAAEYGLPVQSHLSENLSEVEWIKQLEPDAASYGYAYEKYGLFGKGVLTVMAHCVHSSEKEKSLMAANGVWMAHCPDSNSNLASGMANLRGMLDAGVSAVLGSDVAGGSTLSMLDVAAKAIRVSKLRQSARGGKSLTVPEVFYLATSAGASFFGEKPGFQAGSPLHAVVIDDAHMVNTPVLSIEERLERAIYMSRDIKLKAVYAEGRKIL
jgi:guanine deaminase